MEGFSPRNLKYMRAFAQAWSEEAIVQEALAQITWYHNLTLIEKLKEREERLWYAQETVSVGDIFERWVSRRSSKHTQRAYRQDVMDFVRFLGIRWPDESTRLFTVSVADVLAFRDQMLAESKVPKTINRRIASLSSFYKYLQGVASEFRLPITVPNPAHAQFIPRGSSDPRDETKALSATRARQLMGLPSGDTVFDYRDRAIIKFFLHSRARIGTACRLRVKDFHQYGEEAGPPHQNRWTGTNG